MLTILASLAWLLTSVGGTPQAPTEVRQTFRSAANLVSIQASVRDGRGRPIVGLTPASFEVRDNGVPKRILSLRSDPRAAVTLGILVDMSGSMDVGAKIAIARHALAALLSQLRDGEDEVALFTFDSSLRERHGFTTRVGELRDGLAEFEPFGSTSLYDAAAETAKRVATRPGTHKAIIILTDGTDTSSSLTAPQVSGLASSIDVPVYIVATVPALDKASIMAGAARTEASPGADLRDLARWTGGNLMFATGLDESPDLAATLVGELRQQYVLAIEAAPDHEWRRLQVRVTIPAATVTARSGYFGG